MTPTHVAASLLALSVRRRIFGGFAVVLLLLTMLAVVASRSMDSVRTGAGRVSQDSAQTTAATEVALQVGEAHTRVLQYTLTSTMDDQKAAQASLAGLDQALVHASASGTTADGGDLQNLTGRYRGMVDATIGAVEARRTSVERLQTAATELRTIVSAMAQMLDRDTDQALAAEVVRVVQSFGESDGAAARFIAFRTPAEANAAASAVQALRDHTTTLAGAAAENRRIQRLLKGLAEPLSRFAEGMQQIVAADERLRSVTTERNGAIDAILHATAAQRAAAMASQQGATAAMLAGIDAARQLGLLTSASAIGIGLLLAFLIGRSIARPVRDLTAVMRQLADGTLGVAIPHGARRDELGEMARAVEVFKDHMLQEARLTEQQKEVRRQAEADKRTALVSMAETVENETQAAIGQIGQRTTNMATTAGEMRASAARTDISAQSAAAAAAQALANAQTVASAAEQLAASIHEIGGQVSQSATIVSRAVEAGRETRLTIEALNERVGRIGTIADVIRDIAAKTNLLALNATIEAARAGDAGKGFAVVASEVKQLATQTAQSTEEIAHQIGEVRAATGASVSAVARIEQTIDEINAIAGSIAAAVEQQAAATAEIARNVTETATAANAMTLRITEVSAEADQTGHHATDVEADVAQLTIAVTDLQHAVIRVVRTSTVEVDRRRSPRHPVNLTCRLDVPRHGTQTGCVVDISETGARVSGGPALQSGDHGVLRADRIDCPLSFTVRGTDGDSLHLEFALDEATKARFLPALARLVERLAA